MKRGPKPRTSQELVASGTFQTSRHTGRSQVVEASALPQMSDGLTEEGQQVWLDNIGRVAAVHGANEFDSDLFGNYCNAQGQIRKAFREGGCPRVQLLSEVRKMQELLRIAGPSSRVQKAGPNTINGSGVVVDPVDRNPFMVNGRNR
jgi:hypothetical protein